MRSRREQTNRTQQRLPQENAAGVCNIQSKHTRYQPDDAGNHTAQGDDIDQTSRQTAAPVWSVGTRRRWRGWGRSSVKARPSARPAKASSAASSRSRTSRASWAFWSHWHNNSSLPVPSIDDTSILPEIGGERKGCPAARQSFFHKMPRSAKHDRGSFLILYTAIPRGAVPHSSDGTSAERRSASWACPCLVRCM